MLQTKILFVAKWEKYFTQFLQLFFRSGGEPGYSRGRDGFSAREDTEDTFDDVEDDTNPSKPQLDKLMHRAMKTVNRPLSNIEKDKGE